MSRRLMTALAGVVVMLSMLAGGQVLASARPGAQAGARSALCGLTITTPGAARTAKLSVDAHSELMGQYPWGFDGVTPNASDNLPDKGRFDGRDLVFTDDGKLPGAPEHHYAALVGTTMK